MSQLDFWPSDHPISFKKAKALVDGPLGQFYKTLLSACCQPLLWFRRSDWPNRILHNGTATFLRTPTRVLGITADHVVEQLERDRSADDIVVQIGKQTIAQLEIIDRSCEQDLATFAVTELLVNNLAIQPLPWPPHSPIEGRGLLLGGYPGKTHSIRPDHVIDWQLFTALTTARTVSARQISILIPRDEWITNTVPPNFPMGGISGGPVIGLFETDDHVAFHGFSGIIKQHPDYSDNEFSIERIVASTVECIAESGKILLIG